MPNYFDDYYDVPPVAKLEKHHATNVKSEGSTPSGWSLQTYNSNKRKSEKLGMSLGAARHRLVKSLLWKFILELNQNTCFQCQKLIENIDDLSIEHKVPWENSDNPTEFYFNLDNISFSHLSCNVKAKVKLSKPCPSKTAYNKGCRCDGCREFSRQGDRNRYTPERRRAKYEKYKS